MERKPVKERRATNIRLGIILSYVSLFVGILANIFYTPFLLNHLGDRQYGIYSFVLSITSWFNILSYALNDSYIKLASESEKKTGNTSLINTLYLKLLILISLGTIVVSGILFVFFKFNIIPLNKYDPLEQNILLIIFVMSSLSISISTILTLFKLFLNYNEKFILIKAIIIIEQITTIAISVVAILLGANIVIVALIKMSESVLFLLVMLFIAKFGFKMGFKNATFAQNKDLIGYILFFSSFMLLGSIIGEINSSADKIILGFMAGAEYVSIYQLAFTFPNLFGQLSTAINAVFVPKINKMKNAGEDEEIRNVFLKISLIQTIVLLLIFGGFISCGKEFVSMWIDNERIIVYYIAIVLIGIDTYYFCSYSSTSIEAAYFKQKIPCLIELIIMIFNVILTIGLLTLLGIKNAYLACLIGTVTAKFIGKWIIIPKYDKKVLKLPINKFRQSFFIYLIFSVVLSFFVIRFADITGLSTKNYLIRFLIKGSLYVILFFVFVYLRGDFKVFHKKTFQ